jgi:hypothetical protein
MKERAVILTDDVTSVTRSRKAFDLMLTRSRRRRSATPVVRLFLRADPVQSAVPRQFVSGSELLTERRVLLDLYGVSSAR